MLSTASSLSCQQEYLSCADVHQKWRGTRACSCEDTDEMFYAEAVRTVKKDNTFSFQGIRYETPVELRGKKVEIRYERGRNGPVVIYDKGRRMGLARPLDAVANGLRRRREST